MTAASTPGVNGRAWAAAQAPATALRARLTTPVMGRRWRRPPRRCPPWCTADHRCTARHDYPSGEHRSQPITWRTPYGRLIATRVETVAGVGHLELRATVRLPADEEVARRQAQHLPIGIDLTIRAITASPTLPTTPTNAAAALPAASRIPGQARPGASASMGLPVPARRAA
jgi:hypothetical protein